MPNNIQSLIVHKLNKEQHGAATIELAPHSIAVTDSAQRLIDQFHRLYSERPGKGYGRFDADENNFPMSRFVRQFFVEQDVDFYSLSQLMMQHLEARAGQEQLATGGYVLITHVNNGANDFLLAAIVTEVIGTAITEGLEIVDSTHLDLSNLRVAGRVDVTAWRNGAERYISFLKGRGEVANYFKQFLGCDDVLIALAETQKLVKALEDFSSSQNLDPETRDRLFLDSFTYLQELSRENTIVSLEVFSNRVWPDNPAELYTMLANEELQLSDGFIPDRRAIKGLMKFKASTANWKIEFDRRGLRNGEIVFNPDDNTLVLTNIPATLRNELLEDLPG